MKKLVFSIFISLFSLVGNAQLEKIVVEKYYVSNASDSTDTDGGKLDSGSVTYRVFIDLAPGSKLKKLYGDINHPFIVKSTAPFFNNLDGQSFAYEFIKKRYEDNTVALDTWLTLGQTTKKQNGVTYFGVLKSQDDNGSFIGGENNDGGSAQISQGLLTNQTSEMGVALTTADGMDTMNTVPDTWFDFDIRDKGYDSTIFGSLVSKNEYKSTLFELRNSGVTGVIADSNQILVAQLTTKGELSFEMNLVVEEMVNGILTDVKYVANDSILLADEKLSPILKYPLVCGCQDPNFIEYKKSYACNEPSACKTPVVIGCTDTLACNYDPNANLSVKSLCCYPGLCGGRDIAIVCPSVRGNSSDFEIHPNPAEQSIFLNVLSGESKEMTYSIFNSFGVVVLQKSLGIHDRIVNEEIDISNLNEGLYHIRVIVGSNYENKSFIKK